mgnify:CR=1 FL=1
MKLIFVLFIFFSAFSLGCAFDSKYERDQKNAQEREDLLNSYNAISGVYEGTLVTSRKTTRAILTITHKEVEVGKDENGQPIPRPVLVSRLSRLDLFVVDTHMNGAYTNGTGELILTIGDAMSIRGNIRNGIYNAEVKTGGAPYGQLSVAVQPGLRIPTAEEADLAMSARLRKALELLVGNYTVEIKPLSTSLDKPYKSSITMSVEQGSASRVPLLVATYRHKNDDAHSIVRALATFSEEADKEEVKFEASSADGMQLNFLGYINQKTVNGSQERATVISGFLKFKAYLAEATLIRK